MVEKRPIDRLKIQGFKTLQDVELELGKLNVLIGPNGAGKSNLVSYFEDASVKWQMEAGLRIWTGSQGGARPCDDIRCKKRTPKLISQPKSRFGETDSYAFTLKQLDQTRIGLSLLKNS